MWCCRFVLLLLVLLLVFLQLLFLLDGGLLAGPAVVVQAGSGFEEFLMRLAGLDPSSQMTMALPKIVWFS